MKIEILGVGCPKCKKLYENAQSAVKDLSIDADVIKVEDMDKILDYGVMTTPAIAIDGDVKSVGRVSTPDEIKEWLKTVS